MGIAKCYCNRFLNQPEPRFLQVPTMKSYIYIYIDSRGYRDPTRKKVSSGCTSVSYDVVQDSDEDSQGGSTQASPKLRPKHQIWPAPPTTL